MRFNVTQIVLLGTPHALMGIAGVGFWKRYHSAASIMIASGFGATLLTQVLEIFLSPGIGAAGLPLWEQWLGILGFWVGAVGCVLCAKTSR